MIVALSNMHFADLFKMEGRRISGARSSLLFTCLLYEERHYIDTQHISVEKLTNSKGIGD